MQNSDVDNFLSEKGVKPTPNRILVVRKLLEASRPRSLADLEVSLPTMDRASIFRVLELLADRGLAHVIEDGSRSLKYEMCLSHDHDSVDDRHVHFHCDRCKETFCLEKVRIPEVEVPLGFVPRTVNYVVKGLCPKCSAKPVNPS